MDDLYLGNPTSIYWYWKGWNWRAVVAFVLAIFPAMPGYISTDTFFLTLSSRVTDTFQWAAPTSLAHQTAG